MEGNQTELLFRLDAHYGLLRAGLQLCALGNVSRSKIYAHIMFIQTMISFQFGHISDYGYVFLDK